MEVIRRVTRQGHPESTRLRQGESAPDLESVSRIWIWTPDTDDFQTLMGTFLSQDTSMMTFSWRSEQFFENQIVEKMPDLVMLKNPSKRGG